MKVLIVTIVDNINYGTYLQAFATWWKIKQLGHDPIILDYRRPYISPVSTSKEYLKDSSKSLIGKIIYAAAYPLLYGYMVWNVKRFLRKNAVLTKPYKSINEIKKDNITADLYLTGSDQVWNSDYNGGIDEVFYLSFTNGNKCSFSSSVGIDAFPKLSVPVIRTFLSNYSKISVRESFGVNLLKDIGIDEVEHIIDPTFLLDKPTWMNLFGNRNNTESESYLLVYSVEKGRNDQILALARDVAIKKNLKIYWVCPTIKAKKRLGVDRVYSLASVETFLSLLANADFVLVSSFHGTAFSINFNKQFLTISPAKYNSRVKSLLGLFNLQDRYIQDIQEGLDNLKDIDYVPVNSILEEQRAKATLFLKQILKR